MHGMQLIPGEIRRAQKTANCSTDTYYCCIFFFFSPRYCCYRAQLLSKLLLHYKWAHSIYDSDTGHCPWRENFNRLRQQLLPSNSRQSGVFAGQLWLHLQVPDVSRAGSEEILLLQELSEWNYLSRWTVLKRGGWRFI